MTGLAKNNHYKYIDKMIDLGCMNKYGEVFMQMISPVAVNGLSSKQNAKKELETLVNRLDPNLDSVNVQRSAYNAYFEQSISDPFLNQSTRLSSMYLSDMACGSNFKKNI